jgi:chromosome segregation ATPase
MTILTDEYYAADEVGTESYSACEMEVVTHMAEALEDEASSLVRKAASFEEEEQILNREIEERQTEINRLLLKLEAVRSENDDLIKKIESIRSEALALREESFRNEGQNGFVARAALVENDLPGNTWMGSGVPSVHEEMPGATFFQRTTLR